MPKKLLLRVLSLVIALSSVLTGCGALNSNTNNSSSTGIVPDPPNIASVEGMSAFMSSLGVKLKPINAKANEKYIVDLDEKGQLRERSNIMWNQPQINVREVQTLYFGLTNDEYNAYITATLKDSNWWKSIFSIKIHEILPAPSIAPNTSSAPKPTITLISPNGGETWHIGDKVTIKWTSTNLSGNLSIQLSYDGGKTWSFLIVPQTSNTGTYDWLVTGKTSTNCRLRVNTSVVTAMGVVHDEILFVASGSDFTISSR